MDDDLPPARWGPCMNPGDTMHINNKCFHMDTYETSNGSTYLFYFEQQDDESFRTEILKQPSYGSRDTDPHKIHRETQHFAHGDQFYICRDPQPRTLTDAKQVAAEWSKRTDRYIKTGKPFES